MPGCVSLSVRARVGPAVSSEGTPSIQGGISLGVGLTPGQAVGEVTVSSRNKERWTSTGIDWWLGAPEVEAYRVGLRAGERESGGVETNFVGLNTAYLFPFSISREKEEDEEEEKGRPSFMGSLSEPFTTAALLVSNSVGAEFEVDFLEDGPEQVSVYAGLVYQIDFIAYILPLF